MFSEYSQCKRALLVVITLALPTASLAFNNINNIQPRRQCHPSRIVSLSQQHVHLRSYSTLTTARDTTTSSSSSSTAETIAKKGSGKPSPSGACFYKRADGSWKPRKELDQLVVGERLFATRLSEYDLLGGKTGPKVFLECGIGRRNNKWKKWNIVNGMCRLGRKGMKKSVIQKKMKRLPSDSLVEVYVSKIRLDEGTLEVCLNRDNALEDWERNTRISASTLVEGQELTGIVRNLTPYGVFIDVNANRNGLIHISKVAKYKDGYIDKEKGLQKFGLGRGSNVCVRVLSNERKRLELDIVPPPSDTEDSSTKMKEEDDDDDNIVVDTSMSNISEEEAAAWGGDYANESTVVADVSDDEAAMWAAYSADPSPDKEDDEYDEDADIEDALGIGSW